MEMNHDDEDIEWREEFLIKSQSVGFLSVISIFSISLKDNKEEVKSGCYLFVFSSLAHNKVVRLDIYFENSRWFSFIKQNDSSVPFHSSFRGCC